VNEVRSGGPTAAVRNVIGDEELVESLHDLMVLPSIPPRSTSRPIVNAVLRCGSDRWYELAFRMGFSDAEINALSFEKPAPSSKLLAVINKKVEQVGQETAEKILLQACKEIHPPIYGAVCDSVGIN
jgi:hypothetical protein